MRLRVYAPPRLDHIYMWHAILLGWANWRQPPMESWDLHPDSVRTVNLNKARCETQSVHSRPTTALSKLKRVTPGRRRATHRMAELIDTFET